MILRKITNKDYNLILELDKKVYPTKYPVTDSVISSWYINNPEFGMIYGDEGKIAGVCIIIPLNKDGWGKLISGELSESGMDNKTIFDNKRDKELGIHIYHIEKFDAKLKNFHRIVLKDLSNIINNLKKSNRELKVVGFSAMCVTKQGIDLFRKKFSCKEGDFVNTENVFEKDGRLFVFDEKEVNQKIKQGYIHKNRCEMLVLYPDEKSIVWDYL
jgi:hypothetical protein